MSLKICEIFYSIQGESTFTGLACVFVRLSGCNLRCQWCDTIYSYNDGIIMELSKIMDKVSSFKCPLVEITGGEPLLQTETSSLLKLLIQKNYQVLLETNGSLPLANLPSECIKIVDVKCPSSGEGNSFLKTNIDKITDKDQLKFVVASRRDYEFASDIIKTYFTHIKPKHIHISPVSELIPPSDIAGWILEDSLPARLSLQQHKYIWHPDKRGV